jgi:hypothetical protein
VIVLANVIKIKNVPQQEVKVKNSLKIEIGNILAEKLITENGEYRARDDGATGYKEVTVNVPIPADYIKPEGEVSITDNGTFDVREYAAAIVDVITGEYDIEATYNDDGTQNLAIVDKNGSALDKYKNQINGLLDGSITDIVIDDSVTTLRAYAFNACKSLVNIDLNNVSTIGIGVFQDCSNLELSNIPDTITSLSQACFRNCSKITVSSIPNAAKALNIQAFQGCRSITKMVLHDAVTSIWRLSLSGTQIQTLVLLSPFVITLDNTSAFDATPISKGTGYIYVPDDLVEEYKVATNWVIYAEQIKPISELPEEVTE